MEIVIGIYFLISLVIGFYTAKINLEQEEDLIGLSFFTAAILWPLVVICFVVGKVIKRIAKKT